MSGLTLFCPLVARCISFSSIGFISFLWVYVGLSFNRRHVPSITFSHSFLLYKLFRYPFFFLLPFCNLSSFCFTSIFVPCCLSLLNIFFEEQFLTQIEWLVKCGFPVNIASISSRYLFSGGDEQSKGFLFNQLMNITIPLMEGLPTTTQILCIMHEPHLCVKYLDKR